MAPLVAFVLAGIVCGDEKGVVDPFAPVDPFVPAPEVPEEEKVNTVGISMQLEYIGMSTSDFLELTDGHPDDDGRALRMKVQKLVSEGRAEILETSLIQTTPAIKEDDKATLRSSLEWV